MNPAVRMSQISTIRKASFAHGTVDGDEERNRIGRALVSSGGELWICRRTRPADRRLGMALTATFAVESRSEPAASVGYATRDRLKLRKIRQTCGEKSLLIGRQAGDCCAGGGRPTAYPRIGRNGLRCALPRRSHGDEYQHRKKDYG